MHEVALMEGIVKVLKTTAEEHQLEKIKKVKLVVGKMTMVYPDALQFAFSICLQDSIFAEQAILEIEERPIQGTCRECQFEFEANDALAIFCPQCESFAVELLSGREFFIDYIEGD